MSMLTVQDQQRIKDREAAEQAAAQASRETPSQTEQLRPRPPRRRQRSRQS